LRARSAALHTVPPAWLPIILNRLAAAHALRRTYLAAPATYASRERATPPVATFARYHLPQHCLYSPPSWFPAPDTYARAHIYLMRRITCAGSLTRALRFGALNRQHFCYRDKLYAQNADYACTSSAARARSGNNAASRACLCPSRMAAAPCCEPHNHNRIYRCCTGTRLRARIPAPRYTLRTHAALCWADRPCYNVLFPAANSAEFRGIALHR